MRNIKINISDISMQIGISCHGHCKVDSSVLVELCNIHYHLNCKQILTHFFDLLDIIEINLPFQRVIIHIRRLITSNQV